LRFAVIDVETTGLDHLEDRIVECAIVECDLHGNPTDEWSTLVSIPGDDEPGAQFVHGITRRMLSGAPRFETIVADLVERLQQRIIVGHVIEFDLSHLRAEFSRAGFESPDLVTAALCTRDIARRHLPEGPGTLERCCEIAGITMTNPHTALGDARAAAALLRMFLTDEDGELLARLDDAAATFAWPGAVMAPVALWHRQHGAASPPV